MKKNKGRFQWQFFLTGILIVAFAFGLLFVPIAIAQEEVEEKAKREVELEKIVVTAPGKRKEDLQKVPASETYFSDIELEDAGIENTFDLSKFSPNVYIKHNPVENVIIMRGISSFSPSLYT